MFLQALLNKNAEEPITHTQPKPYYIKKKFSRAALAFLLTLALLLSPLTSFTTALAEESGGAVFAEEENGDGISLTVHVTRAAPTDTPFLVYDRTQYDLLTSGVIANKVVPRLIVPAITGDSMISEGETLSLVAVPDSFPVDSYQWYKDDVLIEGATAAIYEKVNADAGELKASLTNAIMEAEELIGTATTSADGTDVLTTYLWTTQEAFETFTAVITAAYGVSHETDATISAMKAATTALGEAGQAFAASLQYGTKTDGGGTEPIGEGPAIVSYKAWTDHQPAVTWRLPAETGTLDDDDQYMIIQITYDTDLTLTDADALLHQFDAYYGSAYLNMKETGLAEYDQKTTENGINDADKNSARILEDGRTLELMLHIPARATSGILILMAADAEGTETGSTGTLPALTDKDGLPANFPTWRMIVSVVEKDGSETMTLEQIPGTDTTPASTVIRIINPVASTRGMVHYNLLIDGVQASPVTGMYNANITIHNHAYLTLSSANLAELLAGQINLLGKGQGSNPDKFTATPGVDADGNGLVTIVSANNTPGEVLDVVHVAYPRDRAQNTDTDELYAAIRQAETASESDFTTEEWDGVITETAIARSYYNSTWYTQAEVDTRTAALLAAIDERGGDGGTEEGDPEFIGLLSHYMFNQNTDSGMYKDISLRINLKGHTLTGVWLGSDGLGEGVWAAPHLIVAGQDYHVSGDTYTLTKEILRSLPQPPEGGYMVPVSFSFEEGVPSLTAEIHIVIDDGEGFVGADKVDIDMDIDSEGNLIYEYGKVTLDPSLLAVTSSSGNYFTVTSGDTIRIPIAASPALLNLGQECDLCAGYIVDMGEGGCSTAANCPDMYGFCTCNGAGGTSLGAIALSTVQFYTDKFGNVTGDPTGVIATVSIVTEGDQQYLVVEGLTKGQVTINLEAFFEHPNPLKTSGVTPIPDGSGSTITLWYAWMGQRHSESYEITIDVTDETSGGYTSGPSIPVSFNEWHIMVDKTNEKVYTDYFTVSAVPPGPVEVQEGSTVEVTLTSSLTELLLPSSCGCYGAITDPMGPTECSAELGCAMSMFEIGDTLGFCDCSAPYGRNTYPVTLRIEDIKGNIVGAPDSQIATALFDPATGKLTISGLTPGVTQVAIEALVHNVAHDVHTAKTEANDEYVSYRYSLPLVITVTVTEAGLTPEPEAAQTTGDYKVSTNHDGTDETNNQYILLEIPFDKEIVLNDPASLIAALNSSFGGGNEEYNPSLALTVGNVSLSADNRSLLLKLHFAYAAYTGRLLLSAQDFGNALTTATSDGPAVIFPDVDLYVPNGVSFTNATGVIGSTTVPASLTKQVVAPQDTTTRGMVHMRFTSAIGDGEPQMVGAATYADIYLNMDQRTDANLITHYHDYLILDATSFVSQIVSPFNTKFGADYFAYADGDKIVITANNAVVGEKLDLQIVAWGVMPGEVNYGASSGAYTITFDAGSGDVVPSSLATGLDGRLPYLPAPTRTGDYAFIGWFTETEGGTQVTHETVFTVDTTVYAQWYYYGGVFYTVTFDSDGGNEVDAQEVIEGEKAILPEDPVKAGFTFAGWYLDGSLYDFETTVDADLTLIAMWDEIIIPVDVDKETLAALVEEALALNAADYTAESWSAFAGDLAAAQAVLAYEEASPEFIRAAYTSLIMTRSLLQTPPVLPQTRYTITFDANGGVVSPETLQTGLDGKLPILPAPTRTGSYGFTGWFTTFTAGTQVTLETVFTSDATIYARWSSTGGGGGGGGSGSPSDPVVTTIVPTTTVPLAAPEEVKEEVVVEATRVPLAVPTNWINPFSDVAENAWYYEGVAWAQANGLMTGVTADTFGPGVSLNRAMLVTILFRSEGSPATGGGKTFSDVTAGVWYADAVAWASANGVVSGYGDTFGPNDQVTREQFATILYNYAQLKGFDTAASGGSLTGFTDAASVSPWAREAMIWAIGKGLIAGQTETTLAPKDTATRSVTAVILQRFFTLYGLAGYESAETETTAPADADSEPAVEAEGDSE